MPVRKLKPIEERDPYAAMVLDAFDRLEAGLPLASEESRSAQRTCTKTGRSAEAMSRKFNGHVYKWSKPFGSAHHHWELRSAQGGIHFHVSIYNGQPGAGLEFHSITGEGAPDHIDCPVTGGRCWHDGTSLYASETIWPLIEPYLRAGEHETIFSVLERECERHFTRETEDA